MPISQVYFELIPELNLIVDEYVGVLIIRTNEGNDNIDRQDRQDRQDLQVPLIGDWKYSETIKESLKGILAFTQWKIDTSLRNSNDIRYGAFEFCKNLTFILGIPPILPREIPWMFYKCFSFNQDLEWDTSQVTVMCGMFYGCSLFNQDLKWNTSQVTDMFGMFSGCSSFNQKLKWDTRKVTTMSYMFSGCSLFNQDLKWDTRKVTRMSGMFLGCPCPRPGWYLEKENWIYFFVFEFNR